MYYIYFPSTTASGSATAMMDIAKTNVSTLQRRKCVKHARFYKIHAMPGLVQGSGFGDS
jgi:hypothetical protein